MPELSSVVADTLASYYQETRDLIHEKVAPISTEQLWTKPYPYGNSIGHLLKRLSFLGPQTFYFIAKRHCISVGLEEPL